VTSFDVPDGVRVDAGIARDADVSPYYDSLLAKVIVHARDRAAAVEAMADALDRTRLTGVASNLDLLAAIVDEPAFRAGDLSTGVRAEHSVVGSLADVDPRAVAAAAAARSLAPVASPRRAGPWSPGRPWRLAGVGERTTWLAGDREVVADVVLDGDANASVTVEEASFGCRLIGIDAADRLRLRVDAEPVTVQPAAGGRVVDTVVIDGRARRLRLAPPPTADRSTIQAGDADALAAPMPGRIVRVHVAEGDHVAANDPLLVLEAMKMEHVIAAAGAGRVSRVLVAVGDRVPRGAPLVTLDAESDR
jgi:3-methylcrotonyl-CoA carboxylase alpha subunit